MRIGLVGAGRVGEVHLTTLRRHGEVSRVLIHDRDEARAASLAQAHDAEASASFDHLVAEVDALVVASPTETHAAILHSAIQAGKPTFCEKPVASSLPQIEELADAAARAQAPVQVGFHYRFDPTLQALAERMAVLGGPRQVRIHSTTEYAPSPEYLAGAGGLVIDKLIHELDMVRWMTGAEVRRVSALPVLEPDQVGEPLTASLTLQLSDGGLVAVWGGYRSIAGFDLSVEVETEDLVEVAGNRRPPSEMPVPVPPSKVTDFRERFASAYESEIAAFLDLAQGRRENPCSLDEAIRTHRLVEAAQTALQTQQVITVEHMGVATMAAEEGRMNQ